MTGMQEVFAIINRTDQTLLQKIQDIADESIKTAQRPLANRANVPVWYEATVLFEFSLGFLCITYPQVSPERELILETFKNVVINMNPQR